jgi:hypothetical protein
VELKAFGFWIESGVLRARLPAAQGYVEIWEGRGGEGRGGRRRGATEREGEGAEELWKNLRSSPSKPSPSPSYSGWRRPRERERRGRTGGRI